jgi:hypothetical protein
MFVTQNFEVKRAGAESAARVRPCASQISSRVIVASSVVRVEEKEQGRG